MKGIPTSIIEQLCEGDIPYFFTFSNSNASYAKDGEVIDLNFYSNNKTSQELILEKLDHLSEDDLKFQKSVIEGSINFYLDLTNKPINPKSNFSNKIRKIGKKFKTSVKLNII